MRRLVVVAVLVIGGLCTAVLALGQSPADSASLRAQAVTAAQERDRLLRAGDLEGAKAANDRRSAAADLMLRDPANKDPEALYRSIERSAGASTYAPLDTQAQKASDSTAATKAQPPAGAAGPKVAHHTVNCNVASGLISNLGGTGHVGGRSHNECNYPIDGHDVRGKMYRYSGGSYVVDQDQGTCPAGNANCVVYTLDGINSVGKYRQKGEHWTYLNDPGHMPVGWQYRESWNPAGWCRVNGGNIQECGVSVP